MGRKRRIVRALSTMALCTSALSAMVCLAPEWVLASAAQSKPLPVLEIPSLPHGPVPSFEEVEQGIGAAAGYLLSHLDDEGRFVYLIGADGLRSERYNVLRHSGTISSLDQFVRWKKASGSRMGPTIEKAAEAIALAARYLISRHLDEVAGEEGLLAVFSLPGEEVREETREIKLGGVGLGLVALTAARQIDSEIVALDALRRLGEFVLFMQKDDGSFHSKYREGSGLDRRMRSLYYPGEAILGLVRLHSIDAHEKWLEAAARATAYLVRSRSVLDVLPADHWLMISSAELEPKLSALEDAAIDPLTLKSHVGRLVEKFLEEQQLVYGVAMANEGDSRLWFPFSDVGSEGVDARVHLASGAAGGFLLDGRTTPTATRLEGMIAAHSLFHRHDPEGSAGLRHAIGRGAGFLLRSQVRAGALRGGIVRASGPLTNDRSHNRRRQEIRIDYVQHALSAWIGYATLLEAER